MAKTTNHTGPTFDEKESAEIRAKYSIHNAIMGSKPGAFRENVDDGYEREISAEIERREGLVNRSAFVRHIPYAALAPKTRTAITGKTNSAGKIVGNGAALIDTETMAGESISPLAARCVLARAGARFIDGLRGDISLPKASLITPAWLTSETAVVPAVSPNYGTSATGTPRTCAARIDFTRKMMIQTSKDAHDFMLGLILDALTRAVDVAGLNGSGSSGQPTGICNTTGVHAVEGITPGSATAANVEAFLDAVTDSDADEDALVFVAPSKVKKALRNIRRSVVEVKNGENVAAVYGGELILKNGALFDVPVLASNVAPAKKLICGDFSQLIICGWGGDTFDIEVNPFTLSDSGAVRVNVYKDVDVIVRNPEAFATGTILA